MGLLQSLQTEDVGAEMMKAVEEMFHTSCCIVSCSQFSAAATVIRITTGWGYWNISRSPGVEQV